MMVGEYTHTRDRNFPIVTVNNTYIYSRRSLCKIKLENELNNQIIK